MYAVHAGTKPYLTIHFQDRRGAGSLRSRITVLLCEQKPYLAWYGFRASARAIQYSVEIVFEKNCKSIFASLNVNVVLSQKIPVDVLQVGSFACSLKIGD